MNNNIMPCKQRSNYVLLVLYSYYYISVKNKINCKKIVEIIYCFDPDGANIKSFSFFCSSLG